MQLQSSKKRSITYKKPVNIIKNSSNLLKKKPPLHTIIENEAHISTPHQRSLPKTHYKTDNQIKKKQKSAKKVFGDERKKDLDKTHISPKKQRRSSSNKKHKKSKDYDSPSKQHEDFQYLIIEPRNTKSKHDKRSSQIQSLINAAKDKLKKNLPLEAINILIKAKQKEQNNYEINYLLGVCYLIIQQFINSINIFKRLLNTKKVKKNIFLLLSVCYKKMEDFSNTEKILNVCLQKYPKFYQAYIYRGKLYIKLKKFAQAAADFQKAIQLFPSKQIGYIGKGDCLRSAENYNQAIQIYNIAMNIEVTTSVLLRRAICYLQIERYDLALSDINKILQTDHQNSQAMYFKGLIYNKKKNYNQAIICYEQAIKFNGNKKAITRSIYEIAKIKIQMKDYYEAFYTLSRAQYLDIEIKSLQKFKIFTDGVTSMMKKNYQKGIQILNDLIKQHSLSKFLKPLFYSSRAYGLMFQQQFQQARSDLIRIQKQFSLDPPNMYNKFICQGILSCRADKYQQALAYFSKAGKVLPKRLQPNFYKAVTLIKFSSKLIPKNMIQKRKQYLTSALKTASKVPKIADNNPSLHLIMGVLKFALGDTQSSITDFNMCIQDSISAKAVSFYLKGIALVNIGKVKQGLDQLNTAIQHDQKKQYPQIYLNRAKCQLILNQANKAFQDLQTYMTYRPSSPDIHIWAGHLLFTINAYEDAAKAYSNINNIQKNAVVLFERAKCYLSYKDISAAEQDLKQILQIQLNEQIQFDYKMIEALRFCQQQDDSRFVEVLKILKNQKKNSKNYGKLFLRSDYCYFKGILYFYLKNYEKAIKNFQKSFKEKINEISIKEPLSELDQPQFYKLNFNHSTYNIHQYYYNLSLCHVLNGNLAKALKCLKLILEKIQNEKIKKQIQIFIHFLSNEIKNSFNLSKPKNPPSEEVPEFFPFPFQNRLCSIFPQTILSLSENIRTRLYFCLPYIPKPDITPKLDQKILQQIDMKWIDIKPQAPWIRRSEQGVIFTDQVIGYDVQLSQSSEKQQKRESQQQKHEYDQYQYKDHEIQQDEQQQQRQDRNSQNMCNKGYIESDEQNIEQPIKNKGNLLQFLKLDKKTQQKLSKLCKK